MTKLHEREPKAGDRFKLKNGEIIRFVYLIPKEMKASERLVVLDRNGKVFSYTYPKGRLNALMRAHDYDIDCYCAAHEANSGQREGETQ